ncbi:MAG: fluoroacetyl-CoA thioesterase [Colwellia sp.]|jgi:fluoroacetyl-CoA thioesterase
MLEKTFKVLANKTANYFSDTSSGQYANVLGTPFLIADMEKVCATLMQPLLVNDEVSVGAHIDIRHIASTGVGASYIVKALFEGVRWGLYTFTVEAKDSIGIIGKGQIVRAIGSNSKILQRASLAE